MRGRKRKGGREEERVGGRGEEGREREGGIYILSATVSSPGTMQMSWFTTLLRRRFLTSMLRGRG